MTHLPFVLGAYGVTLAMAVFLSVSASVRLSRARTRLAAVETRRGARG
jgi:heme exporter protein D